jgi:hypothetical protein
VIAWRASAVCVACFAAPLVSLVARADPPARASAEQERAAIYRQGVDAAGAGRWAEARDRFQAALAMRASPRVLFSLAQCEEQLGLVATAQADYARALEWARDTTRDAEVMAAADRAARALEPRVPRVRIQVTGAAAGDVEAALDDRPVATGAWLPVDPGAHRLVVRAAGARAVTTSAALGEGQQLELPVRLEPEPTPEAPPPAAATARPQGPWPAVGAATAVTGAVAIGLGVYFGVEARSKNDESYSAGCAGDACSAEGARTRRDALAAASASTALFVAGGVLAAGGLALWWTTRSGPVAIAPVALGRGAGIAIRGGWQ